MELSESVAETSLSKYNMDSIRMPRIKVEFYKFVYQTRYLGFCNILDNLNPRTPVNRSNMDRLWVEQVDRLYLTWKMKKLSEEKRQEKHRKAILQKHDFNPKVYAYWQKKARKYPGMDVEEDVIAELYDSAFKGHIGTAGKAGQGELADFHMDWGFDMPDLFGADDDDDTIQREKAVESGGQEGKPLTINMKKRKRSDDSEDEEDSKKQKKL